jgi:site-specific DNA-methyltransferase (adenine-specific)
VLAGKRSSNEPAGSRRKVQITSAKIAPGQCNGAHDGDIVLPRSLIVNAEQRGDALTLLRLLPDACTPLVFFDPQFRAVLDKLKFGNESARQRGRAGLPAMSEDYIDSVCPEIARVLAPSGYLMHWVDTFGLCQAHHLRILRQHVSPVDLLSWDSLRLGMGKRSRRRGDYLLVLQKAPIKAGATWRDHAIPSRWTEKVDRKLHPHIKPIGLIKRRRRHRPDRFVHLCWRRLTGVRRHEQR